MLTVQMIEIPLSNNVKLVQMPDLKTFDIQVQDDNHYIVHFKTPKVFETEFAAIGKGSNHLKRLKEEQTECELFAPQTGPIIIPPHGN